MAIPRLAVVGATGMVGRTMLRVLEERRFPVEEVVALASARSRGQSIRFAGRELAVQDLARYDFAGTTLALFSAGSEVSREFVPRATAAGTVVVDNASCFRMDEDVPLVVPEVNPEALAGYAARGIVANPNCSTIQLVMALAPLRAEAGLSWVRVATYQAASGAGRGLCEELITGINRSLQGGDPSDRQLAFNVLPGIGDPADGGEGGYSGEELKIRRETRRILGEPELPVSATCVRVPVLNGHSEAVWLGTERPLTPERARELLAQAPGVLVQEAPEAPNPVAMGTLEDRVLVGRIRQDLADPQALSLWVVADNLRKGAATNAVQIAESLVKSYL